MFYNDTDNHNVVTCVPNGKQAMLGDLLGLSKEITADVRNVGRNPIQQEKHSGVVVGQPL